MAHDFLLFFFTYHRLTCVLLLLALANAQNVLVVQPSSLNATGPEESAPLLENTSDVSLTVGTVSPSTTSVVQPSSLNATGPEESAPLLENTSEVSLTVGTVSPSTTSVVQSSSLNATGPEESAPLLENTSDVSLTVGTVSPSTTSVVQPSSLNATGPEESAPLLENTSDVSLTVGTVSPSTTSVVQPSSLTATGPEESAPLLENTSDVSLTVGTVSPSTTSVVQSSSLTTTGPKGSALRLENPPDVSLTVRTVSPSTTSVVQPSSLNATGPEESAPLLQNTSDVSLTVGTVSPSTTSVVQPSSLNATGPKGSALRLENPPDVSLTVRTVSPSTTSVVQPSSLNATGPEESAPLLQNTSDVSLTVGTVSPSTTSVVQPSSLNATGPEESAPLLQNTSDVSLTVGTVSPSTTSVVQSSSLTTTGPKGSALRLENPSDVSLTVGTVSPSTTSVVQSSSLTTTGPKGSALRLENPPDVSLTVGTVSPSTTSVAQPSPPNATGPEESAPLLENTSDVSLTVGTVSPSTMSVVQSSSLTTTGPEESALPLENPSDVSLTVGTVSPSTTSVVQSSSLNATGPKESALRLENPSDGSLTVGTVSPSTTSVFQPSSLTAAGPVVSALLLGNPSDVSLTVRTVSPSTTTGSIDPPSCESNLAQWVLTKEQVGKGVLRVQLRLDKSLRLCGENETEADCCTDPLCVLETLQVSACVNGTPQASLLIQTRIYALLVPAVAGSDNNTAIPNQVFQPLGSCPCDLTFRACDAPCCCDKDCSTEELKLFASNCLLGPFGGQVSPPEYQCSVQLVENSPDWSPFLCVNSPPENNPFLGLFYRGGVIKSKPGPSFQSPALSAPVRVNVYIEGSPILTVSDEYLTIPQKVLGQCVNRAPVAFLKNFKVNCVTLLNTCPTGSPLQTQPSDLKIQVNNGQGGDVNVEVTEEVVTELSQFITSTSVLPAAGESLVCEHVTLALDYQIYWKENGISKIRLTQSIGTISLNGSVALTTRYSAVFVNGKFMGEPNSGNPGYQVARPVIGGITNTSDTGSIQRTPINLWKSGSDGLCVTNKKRPVLFGENATSGCLLTVSGDTLTRCDLLRETVRSLQEALTTATYVAKSGNPDPLTAADWVNINLTLDSSTATGNTGQSCSGIPSHQHIHVWSRITGMVDGVPQRNIHSVQISYSSTTWALYCVGGSPCVDSRNTQLFPITSSVTFTDIPVNTGPPKTRFQINFTEYDCNRNDVCWPELAFPVTRYYTGEPYSQSLAKGLVLVFFFIVASILGTPWRQIRQAWNSL